MIDDGTIPDRAIDAYQQLVATWPDDVDAWAALDALHTANARWAELAERVAPSAGLANWVRTRSMNSASICRISCWASMARDFARP
mgnify:CR=1 FL=1